MGPKVIRLVAVMITAAATPQFSAAQRLADWPIRTSAVPDVFITGSTAAFWNPAALSTGSYRVEAALLNLHTPQVLDLNAFAGAIAYRVEKTILAVAYQHVGFGDITVTEDSPGDVGSQKLELGENQFALAASRQLGTTTTVGAIARYARDNLDGSEATLGLGAGFITQFNLPLQPRLGGNAISESDDVIWSAGLDLSVPLGSTDEYRAGLGYGVRSDIRLNGPIHQVGAQFEWAGRASASASVLRTRDEAETTWHPLLAASLRLYRYQLAIARETLVADFGATWSFSLQVGIGP